MSDKVDQVIAYMSGRKIPFREPLWVRPTDGVIVVRIPISKLAETVEPGKTSRRQLESLKIEASEDLKAELEFDIYTDEHQKKVENGLQAILRQRFADLIKRVDFQWETYDRVVVSIEERRDLQGDQRDTIDNLSRNYLGMAEIAVVHVDFQKSDLARPSLPAILRSVKILAPAHLDDIQEYLENRDWHIESEHWLDSQMDVLRKKGLTLRTKDGAYVLTQEGLGVVPYGVSRSSSDVERALALGKAKW